MASHNRASVPDWRQIAAQSALQHGAGPAGDPWADNVLDDSGTDPSRNFGPVNRTYRRLNKGLRPDPLRYLDDANNPGLRQDIAGANGGSDRELLPLNPTNTAHPERPRTKAAGWDPISRELRIRFRNGSRYVYYDVPGYVWDEFKTSESPGAYMNVAIVDVYEYEQETAQHYND